MSTFSSTVKTIETTMDTTRHPGMKRTSVRRPGRLVKSHTVLPSTRRAGTGTAEGRHRETGRVPSQARVPMNTAQARATTPFRAGRSGSLAPMPASARAVAKSTTAST